MQSWNYEILGHNYEIKSHYEILSHNYEMLSHNYNIIVFFLTYRDYCIHMNVDYTWCLSTTCSLIWLSASYIVNDKMEIFILFMSQTKYTVLYSSQRSPPARTAIEYKLLIFNLEKSWNHKLQFNYKESSAAMYSIFCIRCVHTPQG